MSLHFFILFPQNSAYLFSFCCFLFPLFLAPVNSFLCSPSAPVLLPFCISLPLAVVVTESLTHVLDLFSLFYIPGIVIRPGAAGATAATNAGAAEGDTGILIFVIASHWNSSEDR